MVIMSTAIFNADIIDIIACCVFPLKLLGVVPDDIQ